MRVFSVLYYIFLLTLLWSWGLLRQGLTVLYVGIIYC